MKAIWKLFDRFLRGPRISAWLKRSGINPVHYWLLIDLFGELSERRELFSQLGRDGMAMKRASLAYFLFSALMVIPFLLMQQPVRVFFVVFQFIAAFLLLSLFLPETSNSLVNPVEGLVLAHQPIDGATYTAAKLTHLARIILYMVPGITLLPAFAALFLPDCPWYYPLLHIGTAFVIGMVLALFCCALFGWLLRFIAPARLKAVSFAAEMTPWVLYVVGQFAGQFKKINFHIPRWFPTHGAALFALLTAVAVFAVAAVVFGIRSLSGDYLARVSAIAHAGSGKKSRNKESAIAGVVALWFGGPSARAGFAYLSLMMRRDWQFRRQLIPLIPITVMAIAGATQGVLTSPFTGKFTAMHFFPHAFGFAFYLICSVLVYGTDHKGAWLFLLAPAGAFRGFARGVYARLLTFVVIPHVMLFLVLTWYWGLRDAALFTAYSASVGAVYLGLEIRLIDGMPFAKQPEAVTNPYVFAIMLLGGLGIAFAVGMQYLIFHSPIAVCVVTCLMCVAAWFLARTGLQSFEESIRFHLGILSTEAKGFYTEILA